jgi:hypothetical protein
MGIKRKQTPKCQQFVLFGQGLGQNDTLTFFSRTIIMFTNKDYRTCNFIMMNNILGTGELNRKQSNITQ